MERHAKELQVKAKNHTVDPTSHPEIFEVESSITEKVYSVRFLADGSLICSCEWSKYYPRKLCSHRMAVLDWCEKAGLRTLSFWKTEEDAIRQHRPYYMVENGLWVTSRKAHTSKIRELTSEPEVKPIEVQETEPVKVSTEIDDFLTKLNARVERKKLENPPMRAKSTAELVSELCDL